MVLIIGISRSDRKMAKLTASLTVQHERGANILATAVSSAASLIRHQPPSTATFFLSLNELWKDRLILNVELQIQLDGCRLFAWDWRLTVCLAKIRLKCIRYPSLLLRINEV
jgi:hypothetical protein